MNQIVFKKNNQVVCYGISSEKTQVLAGSLLKADEQRLFEVVRDGDVVLFKKQLADLIQVKRRE
ncbi:hypothetical protein MKX29_04980 [Cytobacillus sp. FSL R7-0696]|uniref:hypothetical protein n=1 Tax=Cytobacillus sp. FSL R7-0696 TaxID=2921691 RepID=UPI0030FB8E13